MAEQKERNAAITAMRKGGATLQQIAGEYNLTRSRVQQIVARGDNTQRYVRKHSAPDGCVWPGIGAWMDANHKSSSHFAAMTGCCYSHMYDILRGRVRPNKDDIDGILAVTGLTYEEAFRKE